MKMSNQYRLQAMRDAGIKIAVLNLIDKFVLFDNGIKVKIQCFYDEYHERTTDVEEVRYYEFGSKKLGFGNGYISAEENEGHSLQ
jgi:hypothetical protein